jgi:hypothetical protein
LGFCLGKRDVVSLRDMAAAAAEPARGRLYEKQPELGDLVRFVHEKDASNAVGLALSDPAVLALRVVIADEVSGDFFYEILKAVIPSVFVGVDLAMPLYHPLDVVVTMVANCE